MKSIKKQTFADLYDQDSRGLFEDLELVQCTFRSCGLSMAREPGARSRVRRVTLRNCEARGCFVMSPILEEVVVEGLKSGAEPVFTWGALFDRVRIAGKVDTLVLSSRTDPPALPDADAAAFSAARQAFYADVSWALDIRDVQAQGLEIYDVPAELVRMDPELQAAVRRENLLDEERWRSLDLAGTWWPTALRQVLRQGYEQAILVTPVRHRNVAAFAEGIRTLRAAGIAD